MGAAPALLWIHGGGMITGNNLMDEAATIAFARTLGITVHRCAIAWHPTPNARSPRVLLRRTDLADGQRGGARYRPGSGRDRRSQRGGGLAAGLTLMAHDRGKVRPAFQLLAYPMLDDRTVTRTDMSTSNMRVWSDYAAPARGEDLFGLPPTWMGVGSLDLSFDENVRYAERLIAAGVPCELVKVNGAFHGSDALFPKKPVFREFWRAQMRGLRAGLFPISS